ncbi:MAG: GvpL/GvpF family gas vesicle protein [Alphaproteobacteria bacterium]|nr:GvpL/GvpF family gas vesicle protein [Alphaproteobacteria bacterium]MDE2630263.1 GvpL/GvpF family gas vesicle protein [Alphaproteobacteria bacterium]
MPAQRVYVYGIIHVEAGEDVPSAPPGLAGDPVRAVAGDGLAALVSTTRPSFEDELKDAERARSLILDHHRVLQQLFANRTVLPMRFGALFADDEKVRGALLEYRQDLVEALARVQGASEWGVKIFCDRSVLRGHLGGGSAARLAAQGEFAAATQGRAFFLQRRIARLADEEVEGAVARAVEESRRHLCAAARADTAMKFQPAAVHMRADDMVANDAYLVADGALFFALIDELRQLHGPRGFHIETNGPWPPFSFADCKLGE